MAKSPGPGEIRGGHTISQHTASTKGNIIPSMRYRDAPAAIEWLREAFGYEKHLIVPTTVAASIPPATPKVIRGTSVPTTPGRGIKNEEPLP